MKAIDVARYLITLEAGEAQIDDESLKGFCISHLKIQKMLYFCQGYYLGLYNKPLFDEKIEAWQHGPVIPSVYNFFKKDNQSYMIPSQNYLMNESEISSLGKNEKEMIDSVFQIKGQYSAWKLRDETHSQSPWIDAYNIAPNTEITQKTLSAYFARFWQE